MSDPINLRIGQPYGGLMEAAPDKTMVIVVYALYLAGYVTGGLTTLIGVIMAYVLDSGASPIARSHFEFLRRTFWLGVGWLVVAAVIFTVGLPLSIVLIGIPLLILAKLIAVVAAIWYGVRCITGLIAAIDDRPHGTPRSWLI